MIKSILLLWSTIKGFFKILFRLFLVFILVLFILWFIGQLHPIFDIGIDHFVIKIINLIKTYLGIK